MTLQNPRAHVLLQQPHRVRRMTVHYSVAKCLVSRGHEAWVKWRYAVTGGFSMLYKSRKITNDQMAVTAISTVRRQARTLRNKSFHSHIERARKSLRAIKELESVTPPSTLEPLSKL